MDFSEQILRELRWIKWLVAIVVLTFTVCGVALVYISAAAAKSLKADASEKSFSDTARELSDQANYDALLTLTNAREKTHPADASVYWYRAISHFRQNRLDDARKDLLRAGELEPSWLVSHVEPFVAALDMQGATKQK